MASTVLEISVDTSVLTLTYAGEQVFMSGGAVSKLVFELVTTYSQ